MVLGWWQGLEPGLRGWSSVHPRVRESLGRDGCRDPGVLKLHHLHTVSPLMMVCRLGVWSLRLGMGERRVGGKGEELWKSIASSTPWVL